MSDGDKHSILNILNELISVFFQDTVTIPSDARVKTVSQKGKLTLNIHPRFGQILAP